MNEVCKIKAIKINIAVLQSKHNKLKLNILKMSQTLLLTLSSEQLNEKAAHAVVENCKDFGVHVVSKNHEL